MSSIEWFLIAVNLGLFVFAGEIVQKLTPRSDNDQTKQVHLLRMINAVIIGLIIYKAIVTREIEESWLSRTLTVLLITYMFFMMFKVYSYFMHSRYGKQHETDSGTRISETYNSRGLVILAVSFSLLFG